MRLIFVALLLAPFFSSAAEPPDLLCAAILNSPNLYLQISLSRPAVSEREDRIVSPDLPGREGNIQRYLRKQAVRLSPGAQMLIDRIVHFIRAGRLYSPPAGTTFSDQDLIQLLIATEQSIEASPSDLYDVPTSSSIAKKVDEEIEEHRRNSERASRILLDLAPDRAELIRKIAADADLRHQEELARLRQSVPQKIADLIAKVSKKDLSVVLASLRRVFVQSHPIFGDVRTDVSYPQSNQEKREIPEEDQISLGELQSALNPPPARVLTKAEKAELANLRETYARLIYDLPLYEGVSYWGTDQSGDVISNLVPGSVFELKPFYSDVNVFAGTPYFNKAVAHLLEMTNWPHLVLYKINGRHGRLTEGVFDTGHFPEVIFVPGTQFRVDSHEFLEGIHYVELTEVTKSIATQPKEQELKVMLNRQIQNGLHPTTLKDLAGREWNVYYDSEPGFQKSFSAYAWRTAFAALGVPSVEAFRLPLDDKTTVYLEEKLDLPHLDRVSAKAKANWLTPSYLALTSTVLGDADILANKISVYDRGGGRWVANGFWNKGSLLDSLTAPLGVPYDVLAQDPSWKALFKKQDTAFFLIDQIHLVSFMGRLSPSIEDQFHALQPENKSLADQYLRALKSRLDNADDFIREKYVYPRTRERRAGGWLTPF